MKLYKSLLIIAISCISMSLAFTACDTTNNNNPKTGRLNVQMTDAPGDFDAVYIDIESVEVVNIESIPVKSDNLSADDAFITINNDPIRVNLLDLRNGNTIQLGDKELEAGSYSQIRLILGSDNEVIINGNSFPLTTPSAQQSGLKLNIDANIETNETYNLLIDFDAARSIVQTGNGKYILKPVLHAVELQKTGSISGNVDPFDFQTSILAVANGDTLSTITNDEGKFAIIGVTQGTYDLRFDPNNDVYADTTIANVSVGENEDVDVGTVTLH